MTPIPAEATLAKLMIYPVKSLDGAEVDSASVLPSGALANDRRFALVDAAGKFVNGKRTPRVHDLRAGFRDDFATILLDGEPFELRVANERLNGFLSDFFDMTVVVEENAVTGFPDDLENPGPTFIGAATLGEIARWFDLDVESARRRFRTNVELGGVPAWWEDAFFEPNREFDALKASETTWRVTNCCQRCVVPSRDQTTGETIPGFAKEFARRRRESIRPVDPAYFAHFFRCALNTVLAERRPGAGLRRNEGLFVAKSNVPD